MRVVISKDGGISLVNELGDINIKCRSLRAEGEGLAMQAGGAVRLRTEDELKAKADGKIAIESGKEVKVKGKNIRLHGSRGVSAEGKQVAKEGDKVLGFDVHQMEVPSANGTQIVPLPHPFMGKLKDRLAKDVKMGSRKCATKGSVARHDDATHMQLPGTIKFQQNPKKEGEVTGGTSVKVKINGKEAAVIGSTVTTCNDTGARDNSTVMAAGASMPMPAIINPLNTEKWKREREEAEKREPSFQSVKWNSTTVDEGEKVGLTATVKDIADGNTVTLQVFPEGKEPEDGAGARWSYRADRRDVPPEENPRFIFTAHSAWCNFARSGNTLEVKLKRPEITKAEWRDSKEKSVDVVYASTEYKLHLETKDFEENTGIPIEVYNDKTGEKVLESNAIVSGCSADCKIILPYVNLNGEKELKLYISTKAFRAKNIESSKVLYPCPEFTNMHWLNQDGEEIELCEYGDIATISADVKNLEEGETVFVYVYRNTSEDKEAYYKKLSCIVQNGKISADIQMKEKIEYLKLLTETDKLMYVFVFEPANYKEYYSEDSSKLEINFTLVVNIYDDPKSVNQNDSYILEDIDNGKKYSSEKKVKDDMIAEDEKITLKFEKIKPGLKYRIRYLLENSSEGHIVYDNLDFIELVDK